MYTVDQSAGGSKVKSVQALNVADQTALEAAGDALVQQATQVRQTLTISTGPLPILGHFDVFTYLDGELALKCEAQSYTIPLDGSDVSLTLEVL
jgi:hypothetical protein